MLGSSSTISTRGGGPGSADTPEKFFPSYLGESWEPAEQSSQGTLTVSHGRGLACPGPFPDRRSIQWTRKRRNLFSLSGRPGAAVARRSWEAQPRGSGDRGSRERRIRGRRRERRKRRRRERFLLRAAAARATAGVPRGRPGPAARARPPLPGTRAAATRVGARGATAPVPGSPRHPARFERQGAGRPWRVGRLLRLLEASRLRCVSRPIDADRNRAEEPLADRARPAPPKTEKSAGPGLTVNVVRAIPGSLAAVGVVPDSLAIRSLTRSLKNSWPVCTVRPPTWVFRWMRIARPVYQPG